MTQKKNNNTNSKPTTIGERISKLREKNYLKQVGAALLFHKSVSSWSRIESGEYSPDVELIKQICDKWHVTADYLLFGKKSPDNVIDLTGLPAPQIQAIRTLVEGLRSNC